MNLMEFTTSNDKKSNFKENTVSNPGIKLKMIQSDIPI